MTLYEFFGDGCPHCQKMDPKVKELEEEQDVDVKQLEVWNDQENAEKQVELDDGKCGGVPFFYNTETDEWICGETNMENLRKWALNKEIS
jgi:thiol-disulfide isomerase/thioredoxin